MPARARRARRGRLGTGARSNAFLLFYPSSDGRPPCRSLPDAAGRAAAAGLWDLISAYFPAGSPRICAEYSNVLCHTEYSLRTCFKASPPLGFRLVINVRSAPPHTLLPGQPAPSSHARHKNTCADASGSISSTPMKPPDFCKS